MAELPTSRNKTNVTLRNMMAARGYDDELNPNPIVTLFLDGSPTVANIKTLIELHNAEAATHYLIVIVAILREIPMVLHTYVAAQWKNERIRMELYLEIELQYTIIQHRDVPRHTLLTEEQRKALPHNTKQLPRIYEHDPVARFYGARPGDVFRIDRPSILLAPATNLATQTVPYYRLVVPGLLPTR